MIKKPSKLLIAGLICASLATNIVSPSFAQVHNEVNHQLEKANILFNNHHYVEAITEYIKILKRTPKDINAQKQLVIAYLEKGALDYNKGQDLDSAANCFRSAIYYIKYYNDALASSFVNELYVAETSLKKVLTTQGQSIVPLARFKMAKELRGQGYFAPSLVEFHYALDETSLKARAYENIGDIQRILTDNFKAAKYYDMSLSTQQDNPDLHLKFAQVLQKTGNVDSAVTEYNLALKNKVNELEVLPALEEILLAKIKEQPDNVSVLINLGTVYQKKKDYETAMQCYKKAQMLDPSNPVIRMNIGSLFQAQGDYINALAAYNTVIQAYPTDRNARLYKASTLKSLGRYQSAITEYQNILSMNPQDDEVKELMFDTIAQSISPEQKLAYLKDIAMKNPTDWLSQYKYAVELHKNQSYDEAIVYYQKALVLDPSNSQNYLNLAKAYQAKEDYDSAKELLQRGLKVVSNNDDISLELKRIKQTELIHLYKVAANHYENGEYEKSIATYMKLENPVKETYIGLGANYQALNNYDKAIENYTLALKEDSKNPDILYYIGNMYYMKNDYNKAEELYKQSLELSPDNQFVKDAMALNTKDKINKLTQDGIELYNTKKYQEAINLLTKVLKLDSRNAYAYYYRGLSYDAQKQYFSAISDYKDAIHCSADLTIAYYSIAVAYDNANRHVSAEDTFRVFLKKYTKDDDYTKYAKQRLRID